MREGARAGDLRWAEMIKEMIGMKEMIKEIIGLNEMIKRKELIRG